MGKGAIIEIFNGVVSREIVGGKPDVFVRGNQGSVGRGVDVVVGLVGIVVGKSPVQTVVGRKELLDFGIEVVRIGF